MFSFVPCFFVMAFLFLTSCAENQNTQDLALQPLVRAYDLQESKKEFPNLYVVKHPLIQHKLTLMRDKNTKRFPFSQLLCEIALLMGYEVTRSLPVKEISIETPVATTKGFELSQDVIIVPILRAGLGMADGLHHLVPTATVGHIGLYRDPVTKNPVEYFFKIPPITKKTIVMVVDPMLATGNSSAYAIDLLVKAGGAPENILFMALVAAPEGVRAFHKRHPLVKIFTAALDEKLNDHAYIVPGLGDAGDRLFGTR
ncbi:MAG: uracil phosphoribosyltransferase [Alphaproteobacteria bacterium]